VLDGRDSIWNAIDPVLELSDGVASSRSMIVYHHSNCLGRMGFDFPVSQIGLAPLVEQYDEDNNDDDLSCAITRDEST